VGIFRTVTIVSLGQFSNAFQKVALSVVLARVLTTHDYGTYRQVWLFFGLVSQLFILGVPGSLLYFIPQLDNSGQKTIALQSILLLATIGLLFGCVIWLSAAFVAQRFNNPELSGYLRIFSIYPLLALPAASLNNLLIASGRPTHSAIFSWTQAILFVGLTSIPALLGMPLVTILWTINGYALALLLIVIATSLWLYRGYPVFWDIKLIRSQLAYSIPLGLSGSLGSVTKQLDRLVVSLSVSSPALFAVYTNGAFEIPFIGLITGSLMTVLVPEFVRLQEDGKVTARAWQLWNRATEKTALFLFPICISLLIFSRETMVLLFSEKYASSALIFAIYILILPARIGQYGTLLRALGRSDVILWLSIFHLVINVIMGLLFVRVLGLPGPAISYVFLTYLIALVYLFVLSRVTQTSFARVMPWVKLAQIMALAIAAGMAAIPAYLWIAQPLIGFMVGIGSYFLLYAILISRFGFISKKEIKGYLDSVGLNKVTKMFSFSRGVHD